MSQKRVAHNKMSIIECVELAKAAHPGKYDYSKCNCGGRHDLHLIRCIKHNIEFYQTMRNHIKCKTVPCTQCRKERAKPKVSHATIQTVRTPSGGMRKSTDKFVEQSKLIHGDRFDYSKTEYTGSHKYVTIICRKHGEFSQMATNHISGYGCSECAIQKVFHENHIPDSEKDDKAYLYVLDISVGGERFAKLGYSSVFGKRLYKYHKENVSVWKSHSFTTTKFAGFQLERTLHARFGHRKINPIAKFGGRTECYPVEMFDELVSAIDVEVFNESYMNSIEGMTEPPRGTETREEICQRLLSYSQGRFNIGKRKQLALR